MKEYKKQERLIIKFFFSMILLLALFGSMVFFDSFEWFYHHSRKYESFNFDELASFFVICVFLLMLWISRDLYRKAKYPKSSSIEATETDKGYAEILLEDSKDAIKTTLANSYQSPIYLFVSLTLIIGAVEILDMYFIHKIPPLPFHLETFVDTGFLMLLVMPAIYFTFFRPLVQEVVFRERAEESLKKLNNELEEHIAQRTDQLRHELDERKRIEATITKNQKELRSLASQLSMSEEHERNRIAKELHDNIGHTLAIINSRLNLLTSITPEDQEREVEHIKEFVSAAIHFSRNLSSELSSPLMGDLSFDKALDWLADEILERSNIQFNLKIDPSAELPGGDTRIILLKAIKELLVNIVKHAEADNVGISVKSSGIDTIFEIRDNGKGFNVEEKLQLRPSRHEGIGLFSIREQLSVLKGELSIVSDPGRGTLVRLTVPKKTD